MSTNIGSDYSKTKSLRHATVLNHHGILDDEETEALGNLIVEEELTTLNSAVSMFHSCKHHSKPILQKDGGCWEGECFGAFKKEVNVHKKEASAIARKAEKPTEKFENFLFFGFLDEWYVNLSQIAILTATLLGELAKIEIPSVDAGGTALTIVLPIFMAWIISDVYNYLAHWMLDNHLEKIPLKAAWFIAFETQKHHVRPQENYLKMQLFRVEGIVITFIFATPLVVLLYNLPGGASAAMNRLTIAWVAWMTVWWVPVHTWSHIPPPRKSTRNPIVAFLQDFGIIVDFKKHHTHHKNSTHNFQAYGVFSGYTDYLLDPFFATVGADPALVAAKEKFHKYIKEGGNDSAAYFGDNKKIA